MSAPAAPLKLFISYAHEDEALKERLHVHLAALIKSAYYTVWEDRQLDPGQQWNAEIQRQLADADVVLFLVSADLIASTYVWDKELPQALAQYEAGRSEIVPVILRPCEWTEPSLQLGRFQALPENGEPLSKGDLDSGLKSVVDGLKRVHRRRTAGRTPQPLLQPPPPPPPPPRWKLAAALALVAAIGSGGYYYFQVRPAATRAAEVAMGWRQLRVGDYAGATARFEHAPRGDRHGAQIARLGQLLPQLGNEAVRRQFVPELEALERAAPDSAFAAYLRGVVVFAAGPGGFPGASPDDKAAGWLASVGRNLEQALLRDPELAEAHAALAVLLNGTCQLDLALTAIDRARQAGGDLAPQRYLVQRASILAHADDADRRRQAAELYESLDAEAEAHFARALLAWDDGRWADARAELARAADRLEREKQRLVWTLYLPGPWRFGEDEPGHDARRCLLAYTGAVGERLADDGQGAGAAWKGVDRSCAGVEPPARQLVCAHLPVAASAAATARKELACPVPQPLARCPAPQSEPEPPPNRPQA